VQTSVRWPGYRHVIFDCDATLSSIEGIDSLARTDEQRANISALTDSAMSGDMALESVYSTRLDMLRPSRSEVAAVRSSYRSNIVPGASEVVAALLELGHEVYVVSGGLAGPVREFAASLGIDPSHVRAVEATHDRLSGQWWSGAEATHAYSGHVDTPLTSTNGKASIIAELLSDTEGASMLVGDGLTDLVARSSVDLFVGFGGVATRPVVAAGADVFMSSGRLDAVLALAGGTPALEVFVGDSPAALTMERGLADVGSGAISFNQEALASRFARAFDISLEGVAMGGPEIHNETGARPRVLVCDSLGPAGMAVLEASDDVEGVVATSMSRVELLEAVADVDAIIVRSATKIDSEIISSAKRLKIVGRAGVGTDNIDVVAATARGVMVTNTPFANTTATAEQAMALMLAAVRHLPSAHQALLEGSWNRSQFTGTELKDKMLGIVGFGRIGRAVAARAKAFEMTVIAYDPYVSELVGREHGVVLCELDDLLSRSDIVTLHAVPPADGSALVGAPELATMREGSIIVNAARGQLLDATAARRALDDGRLRAVAVDVYDGEPPPPDHPLIGHPSVIHTPHLGASTVEAQRDVSTQIVQQILAALRDERVDNCVNVPFSFDVETEAQLALASSMGTLQRVMADAPVTRVEVDVSDSSDDLLATVAAGFLAGLIGDSSDTSVNFVSAPSLAAERGISVTQGHGIGLLDYPNLISCRVSWNGGSRTMSGVVFGGKEPRIVQISDYHLDARPEGLVLLMLNEDTPGVIGDVGTLLGKFGVNIAEWRLGRNVAGGLALSFINLDVRPGSEVLDALRAVPAVTKAEVVEL